MQEDDPDRFKEYMLLGKRLEDIIAKGISTIKGEEEVKSLSEEERVKEFLRVLADSGEHQKNLTFTVYKVLKNTMLQR
jgi:hypothetical protein